MELSCPSADALGPAQERTRGREGRTVLVRAHWYVVDGCESERTAVHAPSTSMSTLRNVPSRRRLFCAHDPQSALCSRMRTRRERGRTYPRVRAGEDGGDGLAGRVRRRRAHVREHVPKVVPDPRAVEHDARLRIEGAKERKSERGRGEGGGRRSKGQQVPCAPCERGDARGARSPSRTGQAARGPTRAGSCCRPRGSPRCSSTCPVSARTEGARQRPAKLMCRNAGHTMYELSVPSSPHVNQRSII